MLFCMALRGLARGCRAVHDVMGLIICASCFSFRGSRFSTDTITHQPLLRS